MLSYGNMGPGEVLVVVLGRGLLVQPFPRLVTRLALAGLLAGCAEARAPNPPVAGTPGDAEISRPMEARDPAAQTATRDARSFAPMDAGAPPREPLPELMLGDHFAR